MEHIKQVMRRIGLPYEPHQMVDDQCIQLGLIAAVEGLTSAVSDCEDRLKDIAREISEANDRTSITNALGEIGEKLEKIYMAIPE